MAPDTAVELDDLLAFVRPRHRAILLTTRAGEYRAAMLKQGRSIIRITPERWGPVAMGGFPAHRAP